MKALIVTKICYTQITGLLTAKNPGKFLVCHVLLLWYHNYELIY